MVRPRKIPKDFVPVDWSSDSSEDPNHEPREETFVPGSPQNSEQSNNYPEPAEVLLEDSAEDDTWSDIDDEEPIITNDPFQCILESLSKEWLLIEMSHSVSKRASDKFWSVAKRLFHELVQNQTSKKCKTPSFTHLRRRLVAKYCPEVGIEVGYKNSETGEVIVKGVQKIPVTEYRKPYFEPLYEIASVKVSYIIPYTRV